MKSNGGLYFTDFAGGMRGREKSPSRELPFFAVYLVKDGKVTVRIRLAEPRTASLFHRAGVRIFAPEGKHLGTIRLPEVLGVSATNVGFGDADSMGLYVTARTHLFRIRLKAPGIRPGPK